jgi:uncharacterized protein (TIGR03083 family)
MTELVDASIAALRANHDQLAELLQEISPEQLTGPSGAEEWTVADVLSHLGSGAELSRRTLEVGIGDGPVPEADNQAVWDRWNALPPADQASGFLEQNNALVQRLEGLGAEQKEALRLDLGFLPEPVTLATYLGMRLNEAAAHSWDARVGLQPDAVIDDDSARLLLQHFSGGLGFLLGFTGKPGELTEPVTLAADGFGLALGEDVTVLAGTPEDATATFNGALESVLRLLSGRLKPKYTPEGVDVTGNVTLDDLRQVFPGY